MSPWNDKKVIKVRKNQSFSLKRGVVKLKLPKNSAVSHLPLEGMLAVKAETANVKRDGKAKVT